MPRITAYEKQQKQQGMLDSLKGATEGNSNALQKMIKPFEELSKGVAWYENMSGGMRAAIAENENNISRLMATVWDLAGVPQEINKLQDSIAAFCDNLTKMRAEQNPAKALTNQHARG